MADSVRYTTTTEIETLKKYHASIEFMVCAAEILCHKSEDEKLCEKCPFLSQHGWCNLKFIREDHIGDGMIQMDVTNDRHNENANRP
jgi:hypothetical protein